MSTTRHELVDEYGPPDPAAPSIEQAEFPSRSPRRGLRGPARIGTAGEEADPDSTTLELCQRRLRKAHEAKRHAELKQQSPAELGEGRSRLVAGMVVLVALISLALIVVLAFQLLLPGMPRSVVRTPGIPAQVAPTPSASVTVMPSPLPVPEQGPPKEINPTVGEHPVGTVAAIQPQRLLKSPVSRMAQLRQPSRRTRPVRQRAERRQARRRAAGRAKPQTSRYAAGQAGVRRLKSATVQAKQSMRMAKVRGRRQSFRNPYGFDSGVKRVLDRLR